MKERGLATTGALAIGLGVLLIAIDTFADSPGRPAEVGLFGFLALFLLPRMLHLVGTTLGRS